MENFAAVEKSVHMQHKTLGKPLFLRFLWYNELINSGIFCIPNP